MTLHRADGRWDWNRVASLPGLSPCVDYQPRESHWARFLDALHRATLGDLLCADAKARFLDYGCGVGRLTRWLAPQVGHIVAVDSSVEMIREARARPVPSNVDYLHFVDRTASLRKLGKPESDFDGVIAIWVLQHIIDDVEFAATVRRFAAALRRGGRLYTLDRLRHGTPDPGGDRLGYQRKRVRASYQATFTHDNPFEVEACFPILVREQILGRRWPTALVKKTGWSSARLLHKNIAWARRQIDPDEADYLWRFRRR
jgi:SAM-dependent methyltransferase